ncbi:MAG: NADH-quinone oxidoreductase subunit A [Fimbriimonadales bacterium]|nr:NADH-quinone oxidoreductase subunit A [Fimbriimonadales bacterium]
MPSEYAPLLILFVIAAIIVAVMVGGSWLLGPKRPTPAKESPYECGITPVGSARERFPIHFYLTAMLFIIFDVEIAFLYPFFVAVREMPEEVRGFALGVVGVFTLLLLVSFLYEWKKGALDWEDPVEHRRLQPPTPQSLEPAPAEPVAALTGESR